MLKAIWKLLQPIIVSEVVEQARKLIKRITNKKPKTDESTSKSDNSTG